VLLSGLSALRDLGDGEEVAEMLSARHHELFDSAVAAHGCVRLSQQGEGKDGEPVGVFALAGEAAAAALELQRSFANEVCTSTPGVEVGIALHTGAVGSYDEDNYCRSVIVRCALLRSLAHGGQTLLSDAVRDLVADGLPAEVSLRSLGMHRLKDLSQPERVWQLRHPEFGVEFSPLRSIDAFPNNLPAQLTAFIGRESDIRDVRAALSQHRLVTLTGPGGCGKTRLALQVAAEVIDRHPGGTWWVGLAGVSDPDLVAATVATALRVRAEPDRPLIDTMGDYLTGQGAMVVLDNCEQVIAAAAVLAEELLRSAADLSVLATSREPLGITG